jgi:putative phage-type endonuclease
MDRTKKMGLGGSDAAAICGVSKYRTPLEVYLDKIGCPLPKKTPARMLLGKKFEYDILNWFAEITGKDCKGVFTGSKTHPDHEFMTCNVDGIVNGENAIIECKLTTSAFSDLANGRIPDDYLVQCQHNMAVYGADRCYLPYWVLDPSEEIEQAFHVIERDESMIENIITIESKFWFEHVMKSITPDIDFSSELVAGLMKTLYPVARPESIILDESRNELIEKLSELKEEEKAVCLKIDEIENILKNDLKESESASTSQFVVNWKNQLSVRLDTNEIKKSAPDIFEKYAKKSSYRRFSISKIKGVKS